MSSFEASKDNYSFEAAFHSLPPPPRVRLDFRLAELGSSDELRRPRSNGGVSGRSAESAVGFRNFDPCPEPDCARRWRTRVQPHSATKEPSLSPSSFLLFFLSSWGPDEAGSECGLGIKREWREETGIWKCTGSGKEGSKLVVTMLSQCEYSGNWRQNCLLTVRVQ